MTRFVIEGEWTGYTSAQRRIVHREVTTPARAHNLKVRAIVYTDGTSLIVSTREVMPREKVEEKNTYGKLIREAEATGLSQVLVADLP